MAELEFNSLRYSLNPHESVLDCLLRNGQAIPYACKAGMCQACLIRAVGCSATPESRKWVKEELRSKGFTLACQWVPDEDVQVALPGIEEFSVAVCITGLDKLTPRVLRLRLVKKDPVAMFSCRPGQYLSLIHPAGIVRSYSIANDPRLDGYIELHIAATTHGAFSCWLFEQAASGTTLHIRGPAGDCCYADLEDCARPLILAGTGTGLAPLYGIARDALQKGHAGTITLFHGGRTAGDLYLIDELVQLERIHGNFHYHPCVLEDPAPAGFKAGSIEAHMDTVLKTAPLVQARVFLCGAPDFVHAMHKRMYLKGVRAGNIHCDPFTERSVVQASSPSSR